MIHVIAIVTAQPGQRAVLLEAFATIVPTVRAEAGCLQYEPVVDQDGDIPGRAPLGADRFAVIERWESLAALDAHRIAPHMAEYGARTAEITASVAVHVLQAA